MEKSITLPGNPVINSFQSVLDNEESLFQMADLFPIPIKIFTPDGSTVFANRAVMEVWNISDSTQIVGKYNLREDPIVNEYLRIGEDARRALEGETVLVSDVRVPLEDFSVRYQSRSSDFSIESMYTDILNFPIWGHNQNLAYIVSVFITKRIYQGQSDIARAKEFIDNHWSEDYSLDRIADFVHLSRYHFARLFKKHTGITPYCYYQDLKITKLKQALCDKNRSVADVFASCGVEYSGNYARIFKEKIGLTPTQYRKTLFIR